MTETDRIAEIEIDNLNERAVGAEVIQERKVAIFDLCSGNSFSIVPRGGREPPPGPYKLRLCIRDNQAVFDIRTESDGRILELILSLTQFREQLKAYRTICLQYYDAVRSRPKDVIEQFDRIRRTIHDESARKLKERLAGRVEVDMDTARRLFTLLHAAQPTR